VTSAGTIRGTTHLGAKKLSAAGKALKKADCRLGRVAKLNGATAKSGLVVSQSPGSGKKLAAGAKIAVKLIPPQSGGTR
jgi:beta-lactam-binding protein with PASTA domain